MYLSRSPQSYGVRLLVGKTSSDIPLVPFHEELWALLSSLWILQFFGPRILSFSLLLHIVLSLREKHNSFFLSLSSVPHKMARAPST